jgi:iron complex outermembrane recepter protein
MTMSCDFFAEDNNLKKVIPFDIPQQRADSSLTKITEQANNSLVFPFERALDVTVRKLVGEYLIEEPVLMLLFRIRCAVKVGVQDQPTITTD